MGKKDERCEITKVIIRIGTTDHTVTIQQARDLKAALEDMFGRSIVKEEHHHHHDRWWWEAPQYLNPTLPVYDQTNPRPFKVTCESESMAALIAIK